MAILATRRRCEVTSRCAASESPCSRQRLASMYSSLGSSIGNLRISSRYRDRPPSLASTGSAADAIILSFGPLQEASPWRPPLGRPPTPPIYADEAWPNRGRQGRGILSTPHPSFWSAPWQIAPPG